MNQVIAIPDNPVFSPLTARIDEIAPQHGFDVVRLPEPACADLLLRNRAELALLTPLGYGQAVGRADYRIVPGPALTLRGLTYMASVYMRENAEMLERCASPHAQDFLVRMGAMILNEKFGLPLSVEQVEAAPVGDLLGRYDVVIDRGFDERQQVVLDVSDEWNDLTSLPLPVLMWVCRPDEMPEDLAGLVEQFVSPEAGPTTIVEATYHNANAEREGEILWRWTDDGEAALHRLFEMMFFLQLIPEIPAIKIWGRDPVE